MNLGVTSREEALELVQIGDPITYEDNFEFLNDHILTAEHWIVELEDILSLRFCTCSKICPMSCR